MDGSQNTGQPSSCRNDEVIQVLPEIPARLEVFTAARVIRARPRPGLARSGPARVLSKIGYFQLKRKPKSRHARKFLLSSADSDI